MRPRIMFVTLAFIAIVLITGCANMTVVKAQATTAPSETFVPKVPVAQRTAALREAQDILDMARAVRNPWQIVPTLRMFMELNDVKPEHIGTSDRELTELENTPYDAGPQQLLPHEEIKKLPLVWAQS